MKYSKDCFGSKLEITINSETIKDSVLTESFGLVDAFEKNYSRFQEGNILSTLNRNKEGIISKEIASLLKLCIKVSDLTDGYFDITLLPLLENAGYGIQHKKIEKNIGYKNIVIDGDTLILENDITIEFGSFGKGYILDLLYNLLILHYHDFVIDFGGDIRVAGTKAIYLEDPVREGENIGSIELENISIASSSGNKRKIASGHHLINPKIGKSEDTILAVYVTHRLGVFADIFATALFVSPLEVSKKVLSKVAGLEALIILTNGKIYQSKDFKADLTL